MANFYFLARNFQKILQMFLYILMKKKKIYRNSESGKTSSVCLDFFRRDV